MTQTLTTEAIQEIYEAAVHLEAVGDDPDAEFDLYCKLDDVGGVEATIRKLIDMLRVANREAQPMAVVPEDIRDAFRYRFLKDKDAWGCDNEPSLVEWDDLIDLEGSEFDAAIDARITNSDVDYIARATLNSAKPVTFDVLADAVQEVTGGIRTEFTPDTHKGHQPVPFMNFTSLSRIVEMFRIYPAVVHSRFTGETSVPEERPEIDRGEGGSDIDYMQPQEIYDMGKTDGWNACRSAMLSQLTD